MVSSLIFNVSEYVMEEIEKKENFIFTREFLLRNEFHFSEVYRSKNYIGSRAKWMSPEGVHVNFASDPV